MKEKIPDMSCHQFAAFAISAIACLMILIGIMAKPAHALEDITSSVAPTEYTQEEMAMIEKDLAFLNAQGFETPNVEHTDDPSHPFRYVFQFSETTSYFTLTWELDGTVKVYVTENGKTDELAYSDDALLVNGEAVCATEVEQTIDEGAAVFSTAGSYFTKSNPLPSGRTWNGTVKSTSVCADIVLSQQIGLHNIGTLAGIIGNYIKPFKAVKCAAEVAEKIIKYANANGYATSKHLSYKTKVYHPNGGTRISANGATPVRYAEKHKTFFYPKKNYGGTVAATKTVYKVTEIG